MNKEATVLMTPPIPHDLLGIAPGMLPKIVTVRRTLYLVKYWEPAAVPTAARPGSWRTLPWGFETEDAAWASVAPADRESSRVVSAAAFVAMQVWMERDDER